jgi:hypothetical protein
MSMGRNERAEIKARAIEAKAYVEAGATVLEGLTMRGNADEAIKETQSLLSHAKTALYELDDLIDGKKED